LLVTVAKACELLSLGQTTVYQMLRDGRLERITIGRRTLITYESILRLLDRPPTA
jgi:excisionase family DNA binding protein